MENFQQSLECCIEIWNSFNVRTWSIRYESSKKKQAHKAPYVLYGSYAPFSKIVMWCLCTWVCACTTHTNYFQWSVQHRCFMHEHRFKWISPHSHAHTHIQFYAQYDAATSRWYNTKMGDFIEIFGRAKD